MKLAALGVVTMLVGAALAIPGLLWIGTFWIGMGAVARAHQRRLKELGVGVTPAEAALEPDTARAEAAKLAAVKSQMAAIDGKTFTLGTLLYLALGVPSLAVGILEIGIPAEHAEWKWLPIAVGGLALGIGVLSSVLYLTGSAILTAGGDGSARIVPATLWIRAVRETGTYVNDKPRLEFDLLVEPDSSSGLESYEVTKKATVPYSALASLRVGEGFRALVAGPHDPTSMEILWDDSIAGEVVEEPTDVASRLDALELLRQEAKISDEEYQAQRQRILDSL